jgi:hypothetical protein
MIALSHEKVGVAFIRIPDGVTSFAELLQAPGVV